MDILETGNAHSDDKENPPNLPIEARTTVLEHPRTKPSRRKPSATRRSRGRERKRMRPQKLIGKGLLGHLRTYQLRTPSLRTVEIFDFVAPYKRIKFRRLAEADVDAFKLARRHTRRTELPR